MKRIEKSSSVHDALFVFLMASALLFSAGCGGGGGGGGGSGGVGQQSNGEGIVLMSITFPARTDLTGETTQPPSSAPLGQQVIFTFSGVPDGADLVVIEKSTVYDSLQIYALLTADYLGPDIIVDRDRNLIPARGTFERIGKRIVFTPYFPSDSINMSSNAQLESIPGLLPDLEYIVYVPINTGGSISNLKAVHATVSNPIRFNTISSDLPNLFFQNHPAIPPVITGQFPLDGDQGVALNTFSGDLSGFPEWQDFYLEFDQPLYFHDRNIVGEDLDSDSVDDENMFFTYHGPEYYGALNSGTSHDPSIIHVKKETGAVTLVGTTRLATFPYTIIGLNSIVVDGGGTMYGVDGSTLYKVEYTDLQYPDVCRLYNPLDLDGRTLVYSLGIAPDGSLYAVDNTSGSSIISIDKETGSTADLAEIVTTGPILDLAIRHDGMFYATAVSNSGSPFATSTLLEIDLFADPVLVNTLYTSGTGVDYSSINMAGFKRLVVFNQTGLEINLFDLETYQFISGDEYTLTGGLDDPSPLNIESSLVELGTKADLVENSYHGSKVVLTPSGLLPFGERIEFLVRRGLDNISFGSTANEEGTTEQEVRRIAAEADLIATFTTFDPGAQPVDDLFFEDFLDKKWEGNAMHEGFAPANWAVLDVDEEPPEYSHLLATYGLSGEGNLGDFKPLGVYPTVLLDTDYQSFPLFDGSTPGVKKTTVIKGGVFHFRDIIIPEGVEVKGLGSNPLVLTATGRVEIAGMINCTGSNGSNDVTFNSAFVPVPGGLGGPGGGRGGMSQPPKPDDFQLLTDLRSPKAGETGWGYSNLRQNGGGGGECGAKGTDVEYGSSKADPDSRGAGGGGGSFYQPGSYGYFGYGIYAADPEDPARYVKRDEWFFDDGAPASWPDQGHRFDTTDPQGGAAGEAVFKDEESDNDFIGQGGEVDFLHGGQGGGGGGSRLDSMNPATISMAASWFPPLDRSAYDAKGGGGGGGGGALGIYALGEIVITSTGSIMARGGDGGGGEVIGHSNFGGGGGGGSGGAVILDSAEKIAIRQDAVIDVSGGWLGDAKERTKVTLKAHEGNNCLLGPSHRASFCCWGEGDGGYGGYGLVQLQVSDWANDIEVDDWKSIFAEICVVDWEGPDGLCDETPVFCKCGPINCAHMYYHFVINRDSTDSWFPRTYEIDGYECLVPPSKTPTTLGPLSYGLSDWLDMGQTVHRDSIGGNPAPVFVGFTGIDTTTGLVIEHSGYIPNPEDNDIEVYAPDWDGGTVHYIPEENEVSVMFQGANPVMPGSRVPDPDSITAWTADITTLNGMQFVRIRVGLNTAKDGFNLTPSSPKPQVNFVRVKMQY